jgi:preprotein translocase subunit YajC
MGSNGNATSLLIILLPLALIIWMFWSANRRQRQMRDFAASLQVGEEVVTSSGIFGTLTHLDENVAYLQVAEGVTLKFDRRAIAMRQSDTPYAARGGDAPAQEQ